ncbi:hypothetical protein BDZ97DRAFT_463549 [Flammula alnicola]|nr:hypothetical protein BDZ97DRAFT_463549 [Flammula alnicola]
MASGGAISMSSPLMPPGLGLSRIGGPLVFVSAEPSRTDAIVEPSTPSIVSDKESTTAANSPLLPPSFIPKASPPMSFLPTSASAELSTPEADAETSVEADTTCSDPEASCPDPDPEASASPSCSPPRVELTLSGDACTLFVNSSSSRCFFFLSTKSRRESLTFGCAGGDGGRAGSCGCGSGSGMGSRTDSGAGSSPGMHSRTADSCASGASGSGAAVGCMLSVVVVADADGGGGTSEAEELGRDAVPAPVNGAGDLPSARACPPPSPPYQRCASSPLATASPTLSSPSSLLSFVSSKDLAKSWGCATKRSAEVYCRRSSTLQNAEELSDDPMASVSRGL